MVNQEGHIIVSLRHERNSSGYLVKYAYDHDTHKFDELAKSEVGNWPSRFTMSEDQERIIVTNEFSNTVEVLSGRDLKKMGEFKTGDMRPKFVHEVRNHHGP